MINIIIIIIVIIIITRSYQMYKIIFPYSSILSVS